ARTGEARTRSLVGIASDALAAAARTARTAVRVEERVAVVARRHERLLDRAWADPADQVPHRAGLVVRARGARAAERLLADDRAGRLVVDVEVAGRVLELLVRILDRRSVAREDGAGQAVGRGPIDELERVVPLLLRIDVGRDDRAEELVAHRAEVRVLGLDHGRLDEEAFLVFDAAADEHRCLR